MTHEYLRYDESYHDQSIGSQNDGSKYEIHDQRECTL